MTPDLYTYRANLVRVIDGDSVVMRLSLGFHVSCVQSLRLVGVNAPELFSGTNRAVGAAAKADCRRWFWEHQHQDDPWPYIVRTEKDRQTFGRFLGSVYDLSGNSLNEHLIAQPWQEAAP